MKLSSVSVLKLTNPNFGRSASSNNRSDKRSHKMKHKAFNNLTLHVNEPHNNSDQNKLINSEQLGNAPIRANENILHDAQVATNNRRSQILFTITFQFTKNPAVDMLEYHGESCGYRQITTDWAKTGQYIQGTLITTLTVTTCYKWLPNNRLMTE